MVGAGSSFLGRSILTPKPTTNKPTARRTGNWQPPRREHGPEHKRGDSATSPSEGVQCADMIVKIRVPPPGSLAGTLPDRNTTTQSHPSEKDKSPTTSHQDAPPPNRQVRASFPDRGLSYSTSQRAEQPRPQPRTSEIGSASKSARSAPTASRFQAELDRIEKERDEDDSTFVDSQSQTLTERSSVVDSLSQLGISQELSQDTLRINREHATVATPSRRTEALTSQSERRSAGPLLIETQAAQPNQQNQTARQVAAGAQQPQQHRPDHQHAAGARSAQQIRPAHQVAAEAQQTQQQRTAHQTAAEATPTQQGRPAHRDTTAAHQKRPAPQTPAAEENPLKKKRSGETYRHRNTRWETLRPASQAKRKHAFNTLKSIWGITDAALMTLPHAPRRTKDPEQPVMHPLDWNTPLIESLVLLAKETSGDFARACDVATEAFEHESLFNGATQLLAEIVASALDGLRGDGTPPIQRTVPAGTQRAVVVPRAAAAAAAPAPPPTPTAGSSASGQRAPPSPDASPVASPAMSPAMSPKVPAKTELGSFAPRRSTSAMEVESSDAEDIDILEAKARLRKIEYDLARERVAVSKLLNEKRQREVERLRGHGSSFEDALCLWK
jgi:hypothetical protein